MRNTGLKVVLLLCSLFLLSTTRVHALSSDQLALTDDPFHYKQKLTKDTQESQKKESVKTSEQKEKAEPSMKEAPAPTPTIQYTVVDGDSLTSIAQAHQADWKRLFNKNTQIAEPNTINVGDVITIPDEQEQLPEREIIVAAPVQTSIAPTIGIQSLSQPRGSSAGNTYAPGYCTWYAKSRRPDLPNRLGNAISWVSSAAAQGFATGSTPQAGAIGQQGNHVVYIESVNADGTVTVSEMNYAGLGVVSSRTVSASAFRYIYQQCSVISLACLKQWELHL